MTETIAFNHVNIGLVCRVCLRSDNCVRLVKDSAVNALQNIGVQKYFYDLEALHLCIYCDAVLNKINKFVEQCKRAGEAFDRQDELPNTTFSPSQSEPSYFYLGPETKFQPDIDNNHRQDDDRLNDNENKLMLDDNELRLDENDGVDHFDDEVVSDGSVAVEPKRQRKKKKRDTSLVDEITQDLTEQCKRKVVKGNNQNGLSKRMTAETEEYIVVKLTKEQVLEQMQEKRSEPKYMNSRYKCEHCSKGFIFEEVWGRHMELHQPKEGQLKCEICQMYRPTKLSMSGHMKSHLTRYKCKLCGFQRVSAQHLLEHYAISHSARYDMLRCDECGFQSAKRTVMLRHRRRHKQIEGHQCDVCAKVCKSEESLRVHRIRHDTTKQYKCDYCTKRFIFVTELKRHVDLAHVKKDFYCVECDKHFTNSFTLQQHFKRTKNHCDSTIVRCRVCNKDFNTKEELKTHLEEHKTCSYKCVLCPKSYSCKSSLSSHVKRTHSASYDCKEFPCGVCMKVFKTSSLLKRHGRTHAPLGCRVYPHKTEGGGKKTSKPSSEVDITQT